MLPTILRARERSGISSEVEMTNVTGKRFRTYQHEYYNIVHVMLWKLNIRLVFFDYLQFLKTFRK